MSWLPASCLPPEAQKAMPLDLDATCETSAANTCAVVQMLAREGQSGIAVTQLHHLDDHTDLLLPQPAFAAMPRTCAAKPKLANWQNPRQA